MSDEQKAKDPVNRLKWFSDLVENVPKPKGDSFTDRVVDIESAKLVRAAGEVAMGSITGSGAGGGVEKGVSKGLEEAGREIIHKKLTGEDPISVQVMSALGEFVGDAVRDRLKGSGGGQSEAEKELAAIREKERLDGMFQRFSDELIEPLAGQVKELAAKIEENPKGTGSGLSTEDAVQMVMDAEERARRLLEKQGFSVESVHVSKEDVKKLIADEEAKYNNRLATEKEKWEQESGATVEIEKERIQGTADILNNVVDRVFQIFLEPIKTKIQEAIDKGAFRMPAAGA